MGSFEKLEIAIERSLKKVRVNKSRKLRLFRPERLIRQKFEFTDVMPNKMSRIFIRQLTAST